MWPFIKTYKRPFKLVIFLGVVFLPRKKIDKLEYLLLVIQVPCTK